MTRFEINDFLTNGVAIDPHNARKTKITYTRGNYIICGFYKSNQHPDYESKNFWYIVLDGQIQAELIDGESIANLKQEA